MGRCRLILLVWAAALTVLSLVFAANAHEGPAHTYLVSDNTTEPVMSYVVNIDGDNETILPDILPDGTKRVYYNVEHVVPNLCTGLTIKVKACAFVDGKCCSFWSDPITSPNLPVPANLHLLNE